MSVATPTLGPLDIVGLGLCTPLGLTARESQVEVAAGSVRFRMTGVEGPRGDEVRASVHPLLDAGMSRSERMEALAATALKDCLREAPPLGAGPLPLVLGLPEHDGGAGVDEESVSRAILERGQRWRLQLADGGLLRAGRASFFQALRRAGELLTARRAPWVLVGAVDSLCDDVSLRMLAEAGRTLGGPNREGLLPGEGAGFMLVTRAGARGVPVLGQVLGCALGEDPHSFHRGGPPLGDGLTEVFRRLRTDPVAGARRMDFFLSCQPTEAFWGREFVHAYLRNSALLPEPLTGQGIAESLGEPGAAAGVIQVGMALHARGSWGEARPGVWRTLVFGSSDGGAVGACVVEVRV